MQSRRSTEFPSSLMSLKSVRYQAKLRSQQNRTRTEASLEARDGRSSSLNRQRFLYKLNRPDSGCTSFTNPTEPKAQRADLLVDMHRCSSVSAVPTGVLSVPMASQASVVTLPSAAYDVCCEETRSKLEQIESMWRAKQQQTSPGAKRSSQERYLKFKNALYKSRESPPGKVQALTVNSNEIVKRMVGQRRNKAQFETVGDREGGDLIKIQHFCKAPNKKQPSAHRELFQKYLLNQGVQSKNVAKKGDDSETNMSLEKQEGSVNCVYYFTGKGNNDPKEQGMSPGRRSMYYQARTGSNRQKSTSPGNQTVTIGAVGTSIKRSDQAISEVLLRKAKNLNESLKRESQRQGPTQNSSCEELSGTRSKHIDLESSEVQEEVGVESKEVMRAQKNFNFAQRNEILIKEYHHLDKSETRNFTPKIKKIQLTNQSPTFKKVVHEFKLGGFNHQSGRSEHAGSLSARGEENNPRRTAQRSNKRTGKKTQARGSSQQHQKDWKPVRVNVKLDELTTRDIGTDSHTYTYPSRAGSPKEQEKQSKTNEEAPKRILKPSESRKSTFIKMTIDPGKPTGYAGRKREAKAETEKKEGEIMAHKIKLENYNKRRSSMTQQDRPNLVKGRSKRSISKPVVPHVERKRKVSIPPPPPGATSENQQKSLEKDYIYGEEKKYFPFNPIYTPSNEKDIHKIVLTDDMPLVESPPTNPKRKEVIHSAQSSMRKATHFSQIPTPSKQSSDLVSKTESSQSAAQSPITSVELYAGMQGRSTWREGQVFSKAVESVRASGGRNFLEKRESDQLKKDLVNKYLLGQKGKGFEKFYQREMEAKKSKKHEQEKQQDQRIQSKLDRMLESTRKLYNN